MSFAIEAFIHELADLNNLEDLKLKITKGKIVKDVNRVEIKKASESQSLATEIDKICQLCKSDDTPWKKASFRKDLFTLSTKLINMIIKNEQDLTNQEIASAYSQIQNLVSMVIVSQWGTSTETMDSIVTDLKEWRGPIQHTLCEQTQFVENFFMTGNQDLDVKALKELLNENKAAYICFKGSTPIAKSIIERVLKLSDNFEKIAYSILEHAIQHHDFSIPCMVGKEKISLSLAFVMQSPYLVSHFQQGQIILEGISLPELSVLNQHANDLLSLEITTDNAEALNNAAKILEIVPLMEKIDAFLAESLQNSIIQYREGLQTKSYKSGILVTLEGLFKQLFRGEPNKPREPVRIAILCQNFSLHPRYGDLTAGLKTLQMLKERFPNDEVRLYINDPVNIQKIVDPKLMPFISQEDELGNASTEKLRTLVIQIPVFKNIVQKINQATLWRIAEYSFYDNLKQHEIKDWPGKVCAWQMGVGKDELGIMIDPSLQKIAASFPAGQPVQRIDALVEMKKNFLKEHVLEEKTIEEYKQTHQLYYGYVQEYKSHFKALALFARKEALSGQRDLDIVFPGEGILRELLWHQGYPLEAPVYFPERLPPKNNEQIYQKFPPLLAEQGYRNLEVHWFKDGWQSQTFVNEKGTIDRKVRVLFPGALEHQDSMRLMEAADDFVVTTGDQSVSEAIAMGKTIVYERLRHKELFWDNMIALGHNQVIKDYLEMAIITDKRYLEKEKAIEKVVDFANSEAGRKEHRFLTEQACRRSFLTTVASKVEAWIKNKKY